MNVGGVLWTRQINPKIKYGFCNVMILCAGMLLLVLMCFCFPALYTHVAAWNQRRGMRRSWSLNRKCHSGREPHKMEEFKKEEFTSRFEGKRKCVYYLCISMF
jgi:hypothetical protein